MEGQDTATVETAPEQVTEQSADNVEQTETENPEQTQEQKEKLYKIQYKSNGKMKTFEGGEADLAKYLSKISAADEQFTQARELREQLESKAASIEAKYKALSEAPIDALMKSGIPKEKLRSIMEDYLYQEIQKEQMSPEQRELLEARERISAFEKQQKEMKENAEKATFDKNVEKEQARLDQEITSEIKKTDLEPSAYNISKVAYYLMSSASKNIDMSTAEAVQLVMQDIEMSGQYDLSTLEAEKLFKRVGGEKGLRMLQDYYFNNRKTPTSGNRAVPGQILSKPDKKSKKVPFSTLKERIESLPD